VRTLWQGSRGQRPFVAARKRRKLSWRRSAACEALRKGEFCNCVAKEGRPAREGVPNSSEATAFLIVLKVKLRLKRATGTF